MHILEDLDSKLKKKAKKTFFGPPVDPRWPLRTEKYENICGEFLKKLKWETLKFFLTYQYYSNAGAEVFGDNLGKN